MNSIKLLILFFFVSTLSYAQTDCKPYVPTEKGATWEITNYNGKGKLQSTAKYELLDKVVSGNDVTFKIKSVSIDKKGKEIFSNTFEAVCIDGKFDFGMAFKMDGNALKSFKDMDIEVDATKFEIPEIDTQVGTTLDDGSLVVKVDTGAINMNTTIIITDRKVETREDLTTSAGTFDCINITQNIKTKMMLNVSVQSKEWYSENIGMVRSESYNKKGKLIGYSELSKFDN